jgi:Chaperone of endosialidase
MKTSIPPVLITIGLVCFALVQNTQAVVPAPDGGYPAGNTAEGQNALFSLTIGLDNTAIGEEALYSNTRGGQNTANGYQALFSNDTGSENTAVGDAALLANTGIANTAIGKDALKNNTTGSESTAIGEGALKNDIYGVKNTALGDGAGYRVTTAHDVIAIGTLGANVSLSCFIGHIRGIATANADAIPVLIDSAGQLGTLSSSRRFKKEIKPMDKASESLLALKPVTFHYKSDKTNRPEFGLIAEEVAEVNPDLVVRDEKGEIYTVRYDAVNAMLLNEFLKEHRKVEEQQATITELKSTEAQQQKDLQATVAHQQKQIEALTAGLEKVSAQLELSKAAPQTVLNNQ